MFTLAGCSPRLRKECSGDKPATGLAPNFCQVSSAWVGRQQGHDSPTLLLYRAFSSSPCCTRGHRKNPLATMARLFMTSTGRISVLSVQGISSVKKVPNETGLQTHRQNLTPQLESVWLESNDAYFILNEEEKKSVAAVRPNFTSSWSVVWDGPPGALYLHRWSMLPCAETLPKNGAHCIGVVSVMWQPCEMKVRTLSMLGGSWQTKIIMRIHKNKASGALWRDNRCMVWQLPFA